MNKTFFRCVLLAALLVAGNVLAVTIEEAFTKYSEKKYDEAYKYYLELAEIGNIQAQLNIGAMYARGEYVEKDLVEAYAWISLVHGAEPSDVSEKFKSVVGKKLSPQEKIAAGERIAVLEKTYGQEAIERNLLPSESVELNEGFVEARLKSRTAPKYPQLMAEKSAMGIVDIQYIVEKDGTTRNHTILGATNNYFKRAALDAIKQDKFEPATINGHPVQEYGRKMRYNFLMAGSKMDMDKVMEFVEPVKSDALVGGGREKYAYAHALSMVNSFGSSLKGFEGDLLDNQNKWYVKSAQDGFAFAKYELGRLITYGQQCSADSKKGFYWLEKAARENVTDAQLMLGMELINGVRYRKDEESGLAWVKKAADFGLNHAQLTYAWILAVHKDEKIRNPKVAFDYLNKIEPKKYEDRLSYYETLAVVYASLGDFAKGKAAHAKAMKEIKKYDLPHERLDRIKQALNNKKAYLEDIG